MTNSANTSISTAMPSPKADPRHPFTLAIDIGGTGLKASVLDADGAMVADRVKIPTTYPLSPEKLMADLAKLVAPLPDAERASVGFPGMVRAGHVLSAPHFQTKHGPGSHIDEALAKAWSRLRLGQHPGHLPRWADEGGQRRRYPGARRWSVARDCEFIITLGTGFGSGLFYEGKLMPHLEIAHQPFRKGETYNEQLGEATRKEIGEERWNKRVYKAIRILREMLFFDHLYARTDPDWP